jgi:hypothetical protein
MKSLITILKIRYYLIRNCLKGSKLVMNDTPHKTQLFPNRFSYMEISYIITYHASSFRRLKK